MRTFKLWTYDLKESFDLSSFNCYATDPQGLGTSINIQYKESKDATYITNVKPQFEPIKLNLVFNIVGNGYKNYNALMSFLAWNGKNKLILEYNDGIIKKYCDVFLRQAPKSEIKSDGIFQEAFTFDRLTYWYEPVMHEFSLSVEDGTDVEFPLSFPLQFVGYIFNSKVEVSNAFFEQLPINVEIDGEVKNNVQLYIKDLTNGRIVAEVQFKVSTTENDKIELHSDNKKITFYRNGIPSNGYDLVEKTKNTFLLLPNGDFEIGTNIQPTDKGIIKLFIKRYVFD